MWTQKRNTKTKKQKQTHKYRERMAAGGGGRMGDGGRTAEGEWDMWASKDGMSKYREQRHSTGNVVNGIVVVLDGDRW